VVYAGARGIRIWCTITYIGYGDSQRHYMQFEVGADSLRDFGQGLAGYFTQNYRGPVSKMAAGDQVAGHKSPQQKRTVVDSRRQ